MSDPLLIVFAGLPGTGNSTLARAVSRELRGFIWTRIRSRIAPSRWPAR